MSISEQLKSEEEPAASERGWRTRLGRWLRLELVWVSLVLTFFAAIFFSGPLLHYGQTYYIPVDILQSFPAFLVEEKPFRPYNYVLSDEILVVMPWREFARQSLGQFTLPLWNPYNGGGRPLMANMQIGIFNPVTWLHFIFGHRLGLLLNGFAHLYLMGLFSFLYFRSLKLAAGAALVGAVAGMFMTFMALWLYSSLEATFIIFPLTLYLIERYLSGRLGSRGFAVGIGLAVAWEIFTGHPETILLNNANAGLYLLYRLATAPRDWGSLWRRVRTLGLFIGSGVLGAALGAIQLLPFMEYVLNSFAYAVRAGSSGKATAMGSHKMISFLLPNPYGNPIYGFESDFSQPVYNEISGGYIGPTVIFMALCALWFARHNRLTWFLAGGSLIGLSIVYGYWPFFQLFVQSSPVGIAFPRMMVYTAFYLITLMVMATHAIYSRSSAVSSQKFGIEAGLNPTQSSDHAESPPPIERFPSASNLVSKLKIGRQPTPKENQEKRPSSLIPHPSSLIFPPLLFGLAGLLFLTGMGLIFWWFSGSGLVPFQRGSVRNFEITQFVFICGLFIVSVVAGIVALRWPRYSLICLAVLTLMVFGQLGLFGRVFRSAVNEAYFYPRTATLTALAETGGRVAVAGPDNILPAEANVWYGIEQVNSYDALEVRWFIELLAASKARWPLWDNPVPLNLFNIKQVMAYSNNPGFEGIEATNTKQLRRISKQRNINLYLNQAYQPIYRMVYRAVERDEPQAKQELVEGVINPLDTLVFIKGDAPPLLPTSPASAPAPEVKVLSKSATHASLSVSNPQPGYLYIDQTYFPGWQARVNGQSVSLYRANYAFTALPIGAGDLKIELEYDPLSFKLGAIISLLAALVMIGLAVWAWRIGRRKAL